MDDLMGKERKKRAKASIVMVVATLDVGEEPPSSALSLDMYSSGPHLDDVEHSYGDNNPSPSQEPSQKKIRINLHLFLL
jgi:hypothetical protein